jgi:hypothetical protein
MDPEQGLLGLIVEGLEASFQVPPIHDEVLARFDVAQTLGMLAKSLLSPIPDVFDYVTGGTGDIGVERRPGGAVEVRRAHPSQATAH